MYQKIQYIHMFQYLSVWIHSLFFGQNDVIKRLIKILERELLNSTPTYNFIMSNR